MKKQAISHADAYRNIVLHLPAKGYGTTEFNMTEARKTALIQAGYDGMVKFLPQILAEVS